MPTRARVGRCVPERDENQGSSQRQNHDAHSAYVVEREPVLLLNESPQDHVRCTLNGVATSAFPHTGSELMMVSNDFARRNGFGIHHEEQYRKELTLIDGSTIWTDGIVLNAKLEFDIPLDALPSMEYDEYLDFVAGMTSPEDGNGRAKKTTFICDLHVIEDLPCDTILSGGFVFQHQVFDRFETLFCTTQTSAALPKTSQSPIYRLLFVRERRTLLS